MWVEGGPPQSQTDVEFQGYFLFCEYLQNFKNPAAINFTQELNEVIKILSTPIDDPRTYNMDCNNGKSTLKTGLSPRYGTSTITGSGDTDGYHEDEYLYVYEKAAEGQQCSSSLPAVGATALI